jgi:hypothetical protein
MTLLVAGLAPALAGQDSKVSERVQRDYATVAKHLVTPLLSGEPTGEVEMERAAIEAKERWRVVTLRSLEAGDKRIEVVAREGAEAHERLLEQASDGGDEGLLIFIAALCIHPAAIVPLAREANKAANTVARYEAAVQRRRAASFLVAELAKEFAGPTAEKPPLAVDFDEHWFGLPVPDRVNLSNESGRDLSNCTVQVDLCGKNGKWVRNVHFVASWPKGQKLWADYFSIDPREVAALVGTTAIEVQELKVSLWCNELRSESVSIPYDNTAREMDQHRQLDANLDLVLDYVAQPFFEKGPCIGITMKVGGNLPRTKIDVVCRAKGSQPVAMTHTVGGWLLGDRVSVQSFGALEACPTSVEVTLTIDGLKAPVTKRMLTISSRR